MLSKRRTRCFWFFPVKPLHLLNIQGVAAGSQETGPPFCTCSSNTYNRCEHLFCSAANLRWCPTDSMIKNFALFLLGATFSTLAACPTPLVAQLVRQDKSTA